MKKLALIIAIIIILVLSVACSKSVSKARSDNTLIEPGDRIGDFLITTGVQGSFTYGFDIKCSAPGTNNTYSCTATVGQVVNVSTGLYDTTGSGKLDEVWAHSKYQMFINDRLVDLKAFGTIDYTHPQVGVIRFANVVITTSKAGEIVVRDSGVYDNGNPFTSTSTYVFSVP
jgi:hypothetical protein